MVVMADPDSGLYLIATFIIALGLVIILLLWSAIMRDRNDDA